LLLFNLLKGKHQREWKPPLKLKSKVLQVSKFLSWAEEDDSWQRIDNEHPSVRKSLCISATLSAALLLIVFLWCCFLSGPMALESSTTPKSFCDFSININKCRKAANARKHLFLHNFSPFSQGCIAYTHWLRRLIGWVERKLTWKEEDKSCWEIWYSTEMLSFQKGPSLWVSIF